jgi:hypothetical protein
MRKIITGKEKPEMKAEVEGGILCFQPRFRGMAELF